jgi:nitrite reductase/ring-hydroxylating ferredoxin subunit
MRRLCALQDVPDGGVLELPDGMIAWRRGEELRIFVNICPHFHLALNYEPGVFKLYGELLACVHHYSYFRFADGRCVEGQCVGEPLEAVPFRVDDGQVFA